MMEVGWGGGGHKVRLARGSIFLNRVEKCKYLRSVVRRKGDGVEYVAS